MRVWQIGRSVPMLALACLGALPGAWAQQLASVEAEQQVVTIEDEAVLWVLLDARGGSVWCGLRIDFGNGATRDLRVGQNGEADLRSRIAYRYPSPGLYSVTVSGQALARGLRSAGACDGKPVSLNVRVVDSAVAPVQSGSAYPPAPVARDAARVGTAQGVESLPGQSARQPPPARMVAQSGGMVPVPSFDTATRPRPEPAAAPTAPPAPKAVQRPAPAPPPPPAPVAEPVAPPAPPAAAERSQGACRSGPAMEPREYTQPEILGRPPGERARMCFYRLNGSVTEYLQFFPSGHYYHTSIAGSGGFAMAGAVHGTVRGSYGFQRGSVLAIRTGYQGTGVTQTTRGAGSERTLDVSGQQALERQMVLPNCQRITYRDELKPVQLGPGRGHPSHLVVGGVKWESYTIDCPPWKGWIKD